MHRIVDQKTMDFLKENRIEKDLGLLLDAIGSVAQIDTKIELEYDEDCERDHILVSLLYTMDNELKMADYIYDSNDAMVRDLDANKLKYFVITAE